MKKIILLVIGVIILFISFNKLMPKEIITIKVTGKDRIETGQGSNLKSKYIIYTDKEQFENVDDVWEYKFNSHDFQNKLKKGKTYKVKVKGYRIDFLSSMRNIIEIIDNKDSLPNNNF